MKFLILSLLVCHVLAIWPAPQSMTTGNSVVWIQKGFKITYNGNAVRFSDEFPNHASDYVFGEHDTKFSFLQQLVVKRATVFTSQAVVQAAVQRAQNIIFAEKFVPWKFHKRNTLSKFEPVASGAAKTFITSLAITQTGTDTAKTFKPLAGEVDESYTLTLSAAGVATIKAVSSTGVLRALDTFTQLFYTHSQAGAGIYTNLAPLTIKDAPKFAHRGLNLDVSRNWYPKANILRTIDALSWNKFNRLHLHMTDSQSWPMYIPALPELSTLGAYQTGLVYSSADIAEIQTYAVYRGVEVIIEFDMPGHTTSIGYSHPELITGFDAKPWDKYCAEPPCGALKLNSPAVSTFLNTLLGDVLPRVSPYSSYFHTGGDEVNKQVYTLDPTVKSNSTAVLTPLLQKFVDRNHAQVRKAGLTPIVWEEMLLDWKLNLDTDVVVQTWISDEALGQVTAAGHKAIFGNYNYWYLDCGKGQWLDFHNGAAFKTYYPFSDYCAPTKSWRLIYSYDPTAKLSAAQKKLVLGGEIHMWSEQTDPVNVDGMIWPRAGAAAEVMWSGRQDASGQNRSQLTASPRLAEMRERMVARGVQAGPVQMVFCTQSGPEECSL